MLKNVDIGKYLDDLFKQDEEAALKRKLEKERKIREKEEKQKELDFKKKTYNLSGIAKLINYMKKNERQVLNISLEGKYFIKKFDHFLDISSSDGRRVFLNVYRGNQIELDWEGDYECEYNYYSIVYNLPNEALLEIMNSNGPWFINEDSLAKKFCFKIQYKDNLIIYPKKRFDVLETNKGCYEIKDGIIKEEDFSIGKDGKTITYNSGDLFIPTDKLIKDFEETYEKLNNSLSHILENLNYSFMDDKEAENFFDDINQKFRSYRKTYKSRIEFNKKIEEKIPVALKINELQKHLEEDIKRSVYSDEEIELFIKTLEENKNYHLTGNSRVYSFNN